MAAPIRNYFYDNTWHSNGGVQISEVIARIVKAQGNEEELQRLRDDVFGSERYRDIVRILSTTYPEIFQMLLTPRFLSSHPQMMVYVPKDTSRYSFEGCFVKEVRNALEELKNDSRITKGGNTVEVAVARIWKEGYKTSRVAMGVLQGALDALSATFGCEEAKKIRLFTLIDVERRDILEGKRDTSLILNE